MVKQQRPKQQRPKQETWADRIDRARRLYPNLNITAPVGDADTAHQVWSSAFQFDGTLGPVLTNLLRVPDRDAPAGPRGHRPMPTEDEARARVAEIFDGDFTHDPFPEAFRHLAGRRSTRHVANKTGISTTYVHYLLRGDRTPTPWEIQQVAAAFGKQPSYFVEWRIAALTTLLIEHLEANPETSTVYARKIGL